MPGLRFRTSQSPDGQHATSCHADGNRTIRAAEDAGARALLVGDALPVRLESTNLKGSDGHDGKANFWRAQFASAGRQKAEPFTWSGVATDDTPKGVNHGVEDTYNPANRSARPFDLNFLKVDTDKAFEVAQEHGGKKVLEKDPKTNVGYLLDFDGSRASCAGT